MTEVFKSYDEMKTEIIEEYNKFHTSAKKKIPLLVNALRIADQHVSKDDIKDIILKDFQLYWTRRTIMDALGDDYKDQQKAGAGKKGSLLKNLQEKKEDNQSPAAMIAATTTGESVTEPMPDKGIIHENEPIPEEKVWKPTEEQHPQSSIDSLAMKEVERVNGEMEALKKNAIAFKDGYEKLKTVVQQRDEKIAKLASSIAAIERERDRYAKKADLATSWRTEHTQTWSIDGGPDPDGTDDFFEQKISLGRVLEHLRLLKLTYGNGVVKVNARIMVVQKPTMSPKS